MQRFQLDLCPKCSKEQLVTISDFEADLEWEECQSFHCSYKTEKTTISEFCKFTPAELPDVRRLAKHGHIVEKDGRDYTSWKQPRDTVDGRMLNHAVHIDSYDDMLLLMGDEASLNFGRNDLGHGPDEDEEDEDALFWDLQDAKIYTS